MRAFDVKGLAALARRWDCVIELVPQVGDFVAKGGPLFRLYGTPASLEPGPLRESVALGPERTIEQDPAFARRIIVNIGFKALSPAINDATTAVLAIDQLHHLLTGSACGSSIRASSATRTGANACAIGPPTGRISCGWRSRSCVIMAPVRSR